ncbi:hypothetical protein JOE57_000863 [Microlunatus panaciterrae]|uniref:Heavy metal transporter n=1 Tax=Microlunatus panaciterrae TaxID=400768 RepID=A0ABS2RG51_9ACTN|nr:hypothetical protein [Microlunatus panaciterrae]MBM7797942.1 hypothetical protein [Microlunatus panaciterrae]
MVALLLLALAGIAGFLYLRQKGLADPVPGQQRCVGRSGDASVAVDLEQAHYASIVVGISVARGLPARAASIAMATVYQETGIRNLDYGDRDSVGLFQQRPSQGWGTEQQLMDPYYATNRFYDALVKIKDWQTADINDVAQQVQVSGHPEAYRQHETSARVLASTLSGHSPGGFSCLERRHNPGNADGLTGSLKDTFGRIPVQRTGRTITINASTDQLAWAYAHFAVANTRYFGVVTVTVGDRHWEVDGFSMPSWAGATPAAKQRTVVITVR